MVAIVYLIMFGVWIQWPWYFWLLSSLAIAERIVWYALLER